MMAPGGRRAAPEQELEFELGASSGPGGQNVNRVQTRVTVCFDVASSRSLSEAEKMRIFERLGNRINRYGILKVRSQKHRTQRMNRRAATERLEQLLQEALQESRPRLRAQLPRAAKERRLEEKRQRSRIKKGRMRPPRGGDNGA